MMTQESRIATSEPHHASGGRPEVGAALPGADLIVFNAEIFTGHLAQPAASALAVRKGRIYAVGTDVEILDLKNAGSRLIDAGGRRLIPGISDAHLHLLNEANYTYNLRWDGVPTLSLALPC